VTHLDPRHDGSPGGANTTIWSDDCIELMLDAAFDRQGFVHFGINSKGARADQWHPPRTINMPITPEMIYGWAGDATLAAFVGPDFWSVEMKLNFGQKELPAPGPGTLWGANLVRNFRGEQYLQWVRTSPNGMAPDQFGLLRFQ
jgi:hypothetical protein